MRSVALVIAVLLAAGCHHFRLAGQHSLGWRYLRLDTQCGFIEYDFRKDGSVLMYTYCTDTSMTQPWNNQNSDYFEPVFAIEHGLWLIESGELALKFGNHVMRARFEESDAEVSWLENTYRKIDRISAIETAKRL